jgi:hypothetical protein
MTDVPTSNLVDEPKPPQALNAGRYAERLWGYKDKVGSYSEMGRLYEKDRADFWYARYKEISAHETPAVTPEFAAGFERGLIEQVLKDVEALAGDRTDAYWAAHAQACEEIRHRLQEAWTALPAVETSATPGATPARRNEVILPGPSPAPATSAPQGEQHEKASGEECPACFGDRQIAMSDGSKRPCELCSENGSEPTTNR